MFHLSWYLSKFMWLSESCDIEFVPSPCRIKLPVGISMLKQRCFNVRALHWNNVENWVRMERENNVTFYQICFNLTISTLKQRWKYIALATLGTSSFCKTHFITNNSNYYIRKKSVPHIKFSANLISGSTSVLLCKRYCKTRA